MEVTIHINLIIDIPNFILPSEFIMIEHEFNRLSNCIFLSRQRKPHHYTKFA